MRSVFRSCFLVLMLVTLFLVVALLPAGAADTVFGGPVVFTEVGQTGDYQVILDMFRQAGIPVRADPRLAPDGLGSAGTLIILAGTSGGGTDEIARLNGLLDGAKRNRTGVVGIYVSGFAARPRAKVFIDLLLPRCSMFITTTESDGEDNYLAGTVSNESKRGNRIRLILLNHLNDLPVMLPKFFAG